MSLIKPCPKCNSQLPFAGHECTRPDELQTGTTKDKYGMFEAINGCIANDLQKEVDKLTKALEDIIDSKECEVCKCKQKRGHTYDGLSFVILQKIAKRAIK